MADLSLDIFETTIPDDSVGLDPIPSLSVSDSVVTSESFGSVTGWDAVTSDSTVTSETLEYYTDTVVALEEITISFFEVLSPHTADFSNVTELVSLGPTPNFAVQDSINTEDILSTYPDLVQTSDFVSVQIVNPFEALASDSAVASENITVNTVSSFGGVNPKKIIAEVTDPQILRIERL